MAKPDRRDAGPQRPRDIRIQAVADHQGRIQRKTEAAGALGVDRGIRLRHAEVPRRDQRIDQGADPRFFQRFYEFGVTRADGVGDDTEPEVRLERGQHLERIRDRRDRHFPEMFTRLLDDEGVAGVEEDAANGHQAGDVAVCSWRARSWPQAASMSSPRVARMVVEIPAACRMDWKAWARDLDGGASELPSIGFIGMRVIWVSLRPTPVGRGWACSGRALPACPESYA